MLFEYSDYDSHICFYGKRIRKCISKQYVNACEGFVTHVVHYCNVSVMSKILVWFRGQTRYIYAPLNLRKRKYARKSIPLDCFHFVVHSYAIDVMVTSQIERTQFVTPPMICSIKSRAPYEGKKPIYHSESEIKYGQKRNSSVTAAGRRAERRSSWYL